MPPKRKPDSEVKWYRKIRVAGKKIFEHRFILEKTLGRKLKRSEAVHHIDGNIHNNNLNNLALMSRGQHTIFHLKGKPNKNSKFKTLLILPKTKQVGEIISLLPNYRTYITKICKNCNKLFWTRKNGSSLNCSTSCGNIQKAPYKWKR